MDRYETSDVRRRLGGKFTQREWRVPQKVVFTSGKVVFKSGKSTVAFGSIFVLAGIFIVLVSMNLLKVKWEKSGANWIPGSIGLTFIVAGLWVCFSVFRRNFRKRGHLENLRPDSGDFFLNDYPWDTKGFETKHFPTILKSSGVFGFMALFFAPFNYLAFVGEGGLFVRCIVGLFDAIIIFAVLKMARYASRALWFGKSAIIFTRFPYQRNEPVLLQWQASRGIGRVKKGSFTLRCVEEWWEETWQETGRGKERAINNVQEELWSGTWFLDSSRMFQRNERVDLRFDLPPVPRPTRLNGERAIYWELEAKLNRNGLNFEEQYLVPIY
jgi:protein-S-isoprenylcysteine O-methyltransferase Ste14